MTRHTGLPNAGPAPAQAFCCSLSLCPRSWLPLPYIVDFFNGSALLVASQEPPHPRLRPALRQGLAWGIVQRSSHLRPLPSRSAAEFSAAQSRSPHPPARCAHAPVSAPSLISDPTFALREAPFWQAHSPSGPPTQCVAAGRHLISRTACLLLDLLICGVASSLP